MFVGHHLLRWAVFPLLALIPDLARAAAPQNALIRRDWHFRESLVAIDDWEAILGQWETGVAPDKVDTNKRTPVFPVPTDGRPVFWFDPMPQALRPQGEAETTVTLRSVRGEVQLRRVAGDGSRRIHPCFRNRSWLPASRRRWKKPMVSQLHAEV